MFRHRLRTFTLWTGTLLSLFIAAAFVVSAWWLAAAQARKVCVYFVGGSITVAWDDRLATPLAAEQHVYRLNFWNRWAAGVRYLEFPLYAAFAIVAIPTLLVWRFWPKPVKPGHCRCGYDLTGNTSGVCPECGADV